MKQFNQPNIHTIFPEYAACGQHGGDAVVRPALPLVGDRERGQHRDRVCLSTRRPTPVESHAEVAGMHERLCSGRRAAGGGAAFRSESVPVLSAGATRPSCHLLE